MITAHSKGRTPERSLLKGSLLYDYGSWTYFRNVPELDIPTTSEQNELIGWYSCHQ